MHVAPHQPPTRNWPLTNYPSVHGDGDKPSRPKSNAWTATPDNRRCHRAIEHVYIGAHTSSFLYKHTLMILVIGMLKNVCRNICRKHIHKTNPKRWIGIRCISNAHATAIACKMMRRLQVRATTAHQTAKRALVLLTGDHIVAQFSTHVHVSLYVISI